jgi:hypothetical protein
MAKNPIDPIVYYEPGPGPDAAYWTKADMLRYIHAPCPGEGCACDQRYAEWRARTGEWVAEDPTGPMGDTGSALIVTIVPTLTCIAWRHPDPKRRRWALRVLTLPLYREWERAMDCLELAERPEAEIETRRAERRLQARGEH